MSKINLSLKKYVEVMVKPRLDNNQVVQMYLDMAQVMDTLGLDSFSMMPDEILLKAKRQGIAANIKDYKEIDWLDFLSDPHVAKYAEDVITKNNMVKYRKMLNDLTNSGLTTNTDIQKFKFLKDIVDKAKDNVENSIVHVTQHYPTRRVYNTTPSKKDEAETKREFLEILDYLEIDTDYTKVFDEKGYEKKIEKIKVEAKESKDKVEEKQVKHMNIREKQAALAAKIKKLKEGA